MSLHVFDVANNLWQQEKCTVMIPVGTHAKLEWEQGYTQWKLCDTESFIELRNIVELLYVIDQICETTSKKFSEENCSEINQCNVINTICLHFFFCL